MYKHQHHISGVFFLPRGSIISIILAVVGFIAFSPVFLQFPSEISFYKSLLQQALPILSPNTDTVWRVTDYDLLANTILSIQSSAEMRKKYAAHYGGVKKEENPDTVLYEANSLSVAEEDLSTDNISFINSPGAHIDENELLHAPLSFVSKNDEPRVLIVHTHTSEAYQSSPSSRSEQPDENVVRVGKEIATYLKKSGVSVIHDTTKNDSPSYNQSYKKTMAVIDENLKRNQTLEIVLDIHRDYIEREDGTLSKPTAIVDGKKAAQIMFVIGTDAMDLYHPNWRHNLSFAVKIQDELNRIAPGLCRPINIRTERFNQHMTKGSMIIEVGTGVNTLEEAIYSGELIGKAIGKILTQ